MDKLERSIQELRQFGEGLGFWPPKSTWNLYAVEHGFYTFQNIEYHTQKNWEWYRNQFGIPLKQQKFTEEQCIDALKTASKYMGNQFSRRQYESWQKDKPELPSKTQIGTQLGTWNAARVAAGLVEAKVYGRRSYTEDELLDILRKCAQETNIDFSESEYESWRNPKIHPSVETIRRHFKSMQTARQILSLPLKEGKSPVLYGNGEWLPHMLAFVRDSLSASQYNAWRVKNLGAPSIKALQQNVESFSKALQQAMELTLDRWKEGKR